MGKKLLSTNFLLALVMLGAALFSLPSSVGSQVAEAVLAVVAAVGLVRQAIKNAVFVGWPAVLRDLNVWNYIVGVAVAITPMAADVAPTLRRAIDAVLLKDWGGLLAAAFALVTIIIKWRETPRKNP